MKETWLKCNDCNTRASGVWIVFNNDERVRLVKLCAQCGLYSYVKRRAIFSPTLRLELLKTFNTGFRQVHRPKDDVPEKHWVEHPVTPEHRYPNGMTAQQLLKALAAKRHGPSTVHPSLLNFHKD